MARGKHLFPFRTEQLSPSAPMVLGPQGPGRVGRRRFSFATRPSPERRRPFVVLGREAWLRAGPVAVHRRHRGQAAAPSRTAPPARSAPRLGRVRAPRLGGGNGFMRPFCARAVPTALVTPPNCVSLPQTWPAAAVALVPGRGANALCAETAR